MKCMFLEIHVWCSVADPGGGGGPRGPCPPLVKIGQKKMAAECGGLYFMFLGPPSPKNIFSTSDSKNADVLLLSKVRNFLPNPLPHPLPSVIGCDRSAYPIRQIT